MLRSVFKLLKKNFKKITSTIFTFIFLLNPLLGAMPILAQEILPETPEVVSVPEETVQPSEEQAPVQEEVTPVEVLPVEEIIPVEVVLPTEEVLTPPVEELTPVITPEVIPPIIINEIVPDPTPTYPKIEDAIEWITNSDGSFTTSKAVELDKVYENKSLDGIKIVFRELPEVSSPITVAINNVENSINNSEVVSKAYELTTDMVNGTFKYDLYLPYSSSEKDVKVLYSENNVDFKDVKNETVLDSQVIIKGLDHFTIFVVVSPNTPVNCDTVSIIRGGCFDTISAAVAVAAPSDEILIGSGTYTLTSVINITVPNLTIKGSGVGSTYIQGGISVGSNFFSVTASGFTLQDVELVKTDQAGVQNLIYIGASNTTIKNNSIHGQFVIGDGDVSRAMVVSGGLSGLQIEGNTIYSLRQPGYFTGPTTGNIVNNYVYGTKGWVMEGGDMTFTGNNWGTGAQANVYDIAILALAPLSAYTDIVSMSNLNNGAVIEDQRVSPAVLSTVYVDASTAFTSDLGGRYHPYSSISPALVRVVERGKIYVSNGTYTEQLVVSKDVTIFGQTEGGTIIQAPSVLVDSPMGPSTKAIVLVNNGKMVTMTDMSIIGPGPSSCGSIQFGIFIGGGATLRANHITVNDIRDNPASGCQNGAGIFVGRQSLGQVGTLHGRYLTVTNYQKGGIVVDNVGSYADISDSTVTGLGSIDFIAQNGIQISRGATGLITSSNISGNIYDKPSDTTYNHASAGILLYQEGNGVSISGNTISNNDSGLYEYSTSSGLTAVNNTFTNNYWNVTYDNPGNIDLKSNTWSGLLSLNSQESKINHNCDASPYTHGTCSATDDYSSGGSVDYFNGDATAPVISFTGFKDQTSATYNTSPSTKTCGSYNSTGFISFEWELTNTETLPVTYKYTIVSGPAAGFSTTTTNTHHNGMIPAEGTYVVSVFGTDQAENVGVAQQCSVTYDKTSPNIPTGGLPHLSVIPTNNFDFTWNASTDSSLPLTYEFQSSLNPAQTGGVLTTGLWKSNILPSNMIHSSGAPDGVWYWQVRAIDAAGNKSGWSTIWNVTLDTHAPAAPTGLKFQNTTRTTDIACDSVIQLQAVTPDWNNITGDPSFSHFEYTSFWPDGHIGINEQSVTNSEYPNTWMPPAEGAYGYAVRSVDVAGNKSVWSLSEKSLAGSCKVIYDSTAPVITLYDPNPQIIEVFSPYIEQFASVTDNHDLGLLATIDASSVNTSVLGTYYVTYDVTDTAGNAAIQKVREVRVVDTQAPVITLLGDNPLTIEGGNSYSEPGATVSDNYDSGLGVSIVEYIDILHVGSYTVTYDAVDSSGNHATQVIRVVDIVDRTKPSVTDLKFSGLLFTVDYNPYLFGNGFIVSARVTDSFTGIDSTSCRFSFNGIEEIGTYIANRCVLMTHTPDDPTAIVITASVKDIAGNTGDTSTTRISDANNPVTAVTIAKNYYGPLTYDSGTINGVATDSASQVELLKVTIKRTDNRYWSGTSFCYLFCYAPTFLNVTPFATWTYGGLSKTALVNGTRYTVTPYATDSVNHIAQGSSDSFIYDSVNPIDPTSFTHTRAGVTTNNVINVDWPDVGIFGGAYDALSGVAGYSYLFSTDVSAIPNDVLMTTDTYATSGTLADGTWYFTLRTVDNAGNWTSTVHIGPFIIDTTSPTLNVSTPADDAWGNIFQIAGTATDATSGIQDITAYFHWFTSPAIPATCSANYNIADGTWNINVNNDLLCMVPTGRYNIEVVARDNAYNTTTVIVSDIKVDTTGPVIGTVSYVVDFNPYINGNGFIVSAPVSESYSETNARRGLNASSCKLTIDGGATWVSGTYILGTCLKTFSASENQVVNANVKAQDLLGNESVGTQVVRTSDRNRPNTTVAIANDFYGNATFGSTVINGTSSDNVSGVSKVYLTIQRNSDNKFWNGATWCSSCVLSKILTPIGTTTWSYDGTGISFTDGVTYTVNAYAKDNVFNISSNSSDSFTWDDISPTVDLDFPIIGFAGTSILARFSENVVKSQAEDAANYYLSNWPTAGGSGDLVDDATISYDESTFVATITFTTPGWYVSPEQMWGVQNIHDLAGNTQAVTPYQEYSTPMVAPVTTISGVDDNWHNSDVVVTLICTDVDGSGCYKTYYSFDKIAFSEGSTFTVSTEGENFVYYYSEDRAGNVEDTNGYKYIKIDKTAPTNPDVTTTPLVDTHTSTNVITANWTADLGSIEAQEIVPVIPAHDDLSGVNGFAYSFTQVADSDPNILDVVDKYISSATSGTLVDGTWYFHIKTVDMAGNWSLPKHVGPIYLDSTKPVITRLGGSPISIIIGSTYNDLGADATDLIDGNISANVLVFNPVNENALGTYTVTYNVSDAAGNAADQVTRTVNVNPAPTIAAVQGVQTVASTTTETPEETGEVLGLTCTTQQLLSGYVYVDKNNNDSMDSNESGVANVKMNIYYTDTSGVKTLLTTVTTNNSGYWSVNACPTSYTVEIDSTTLPTNVKLSGDASKTVELTEGSNVEGINFIATTESTPFNWLWVIIPLLTLIVLTAGYYIVRKRK
ncbi:DUF5011 domain-containing protein [Candidatus Dojkabacteria bacterium]|jgi:hypothetical protein|nr:DUF5011 domain-containing protein [Candidatus Dojkabacteria bacterium]